MWSDSIRYALLLAPLSFVAAASSTLPPPLTANVAADNSYNVIEFLLDDVGIDFLSLYDDENAWPAGFAYPATPVIDAIAARGVTFRNAWAHPVCSADRAAVLTGMHGVVTASHPYGTAIGSTVDHDSLTTLIPESMAFPFAHKAEGTLYKHLHVGKWHLGSGQDDPMSPITAGGVTEYRGCLTNPAQHQGVGPGAGYVGDYDNYTQTLATSAGALQLPHQVVWMGAQEVSDSLALLPTDSTPFILRHWFHDAHAPWFDVVPDAQLGTHATMRGNAQFPLAPNSSFVYSPSSNPLDPAYPDPNVYNLVHRRMKAMIEASDKAIGDVLAGLTAEQRLKTIVIIRGDNGTERLGLNPNPSPATSPPTSPSEPPAVYNPEHGKSKLYEQGIRVPLIIGAHPANWTPTWVRPSLRGTKVDALASTVDVWATIADATLPNWKNYKTDGESLLPVLSGLATQVRSHIFSFFFSFRTTPGETAWTSADPARAAVRNQAGYKLIRRVGVLDELYDLSVDPLEVNNLCPPGSPAEIAAHAELGSELDKILSPVAPTSFCFGDGSSLPCPCSNNNDAALYGGHAGCANSSYSTGSLLFGTGTSSVNADTIVLHAVAATPNQSGYFFQGDDALTGGNVNLLAHGLRCASGSILRLQGATINDQGYATTSLSLAAKGAVSAGMTKRYQFWYRDGSVNQCNDPLTNSNLSNAVEIAWTL